MEEKLVQAVEQIKSSKEISDLDKPLILKKIEEWKQEKSAISELNNKLQEWWLKIEPIFAEIGLVQTVEIYTQYTYEKKWTKISIKEALRMIAEEMPEADVEGTLAYILAETTKGKTVTLGECRFMS